jgi:hypothetical protein
LRPELAPRAKSPGAGGPWCAGIRPAGAPPSEHGNARPEELGPHGIPLARDATKERLAIEPTLGDHITQPFRIGINLVALALLANKQPQGATVNRKIVKDHAIQRRRAHASPRDPSTIEKNFELAAYGGLGQLQDCGDFADRQFVKLKHTEQANSHRIR